MASPKVKPGERETVTRIQAIMAEYNAALVGSGALTLAQIERISIEFNLYDKLLEASAKGSDYAAVYRKTKGSVTLNLYDDIPNIYPKLDRKVKSLSWTDDNINLSTRIHGVVKTTNRAIRSEIRSAIEQNKSIRELSMGIFEGYDFRRELPRPAPMIRKDLDKLVKSVKNVPLGSKEYTEKILPEIAKLKSKVKDLVTPGLRSSYQELLKAVEDGGQDLIDNAYYVATQEKGRYYANRVARTELSRADYEGFMVDAMDDEDVIGVRYFLSSAHVIPDICDSWTQINLGYGTGVYPVNSQPPYPFHPHCFCNYEQVFISKDLDRSTRISKEQLKESGNSYLEGLSSDRRAEIMGVRNSIDFEESTSKDWRKYSPNFKPLTNPTKNIRFENSDFIPS